MSSPLQKLNQLKIPLKDIQDATNNFSNENIIRQGGFGKIYKGKLNRSGGESIDIVARRLDTKYGQGNVQFLTEILMLSKLKHENLVSLIGFCDEKNVKIVVNKYEAKGSLDNYLTDPNLTWEKRLQICVGIAHALRYIYYDEKRDFSVIHRNIKSSKILLDNFWVPKLSGFELSMTTVASRRDRLCLEDVCGSTGYFDPVYAKTGSVTHKSDIYSFGVILFEVLFGAHAITDKRDIMLAKMAKYLYEKKKLVLQKQMDQKSLEIFSETAYDCLKEHRAGRPNIHLVVVKLETALYLQRERLDKTIYLQRKPELYWGRLHFNYALIKRKTYKFADHCCIQDFKRFKVYKAKLDIFKSSYTSKIEGKTDRVHGRKYCDVAIKRYMYTPGKEELFIAERESQFEHPNLVYILGWSSSTWESLIIVYELPSNGSLADHMRSTSNMSYFTWVQRLKICIDIAHGLNYIHSHPSYSTKKIHRTISSSNILLKENWVAVIGGFTKSKKPDSLNPDTWLKIKQQADIFHFGIVLFEILCWRFTNDPIYLQKNDTGLVSLVRRCFKDGTQSEILDLKLVGEAEKDYLSMGIDHNSLETFSKIAYQCLGEDDYQLRPTAEVVLNELKKALYLQESQEKNNNLQISLADIKFATQDFSRDNLIGEGGFGKVYSGKLPSAQRHKIIAAKRLDITSDQGETELMTELVILSEYKHKNIIDLVSYCNEDGEKVIVYDHAAKGSLDKWLKCKELTWRRRLGICVDIARGLNFLHGTNDVKHDVVIHRDLKSANILLHDDWKASIADFGLSLVSPINRDIYYVIDKVKGTRGYCDPVYITTGFLTKESDIYSFGVLLFEILCGRYVMESNSSGAQNLVDFVRYHFEEGTLYEMVFEETKKQMVSISLTKFQDIAYQCINDERSKRPTSYDVLMQLEKALEVQEKWDNLCSISLDDIILATQNFSHDNLIGRGDFWSVYKGELTSADGCEIIAMKRFDRMSDQRETERMADIEVLSNYAHENVMSLFGYCYEKGEKIIVYQFPPISNGTLDRWLKYDGLSWRKRLEICIDIARGLVFLHGTSGAKQEVMIHGDIKSTNVILHGDWKAKIAYFGCSLISPMNPELKYVVNNAKGTPGYCDPLYKTTGVLTKESDIYSFGVLLLEMMCGRLVMEHDSSNRAQNLVSMFRYHRAEGKLSEIIFQAVREQIVDISLTTFQDIACECVSESIAGRPTASNVLKQLSNALEFQLDIKVWKPKLPRDIYKIKQMSYGYYRWHCNKDIYELLQKGFLLRKKNAWFCLGTDGRRVEVVSAIEFQLKSYFEPDKWISTPESRFKEVAWIADSSMMYMNFKIKAHLLLPGFNYGVNLLFKFCAPRENSDTSIDLEYHIGNKFLRSHCTTERDDGWLVKELFQFPCLAAEAEIDVFLLGFSESHYVNQAVYIEGIEFQAINNMTDEETEDLKRVSMANVQQSITEAGHWKVNMAEVQELPVEEGGLVLRILDWLLVKCCG